MNKAIVVKSVGGPEVLQFVEQEAGKPGPGEALVEHKAIGLNFIDVYFRTGLYPADTPFVPGGEAAGIVLAVGEGVTHVKEGDRVAYVVRNGAYAERRTVPADRLVKIPDGIDFDIAAAIMLKGMTAEYLLRRTYKVQKGDTILFHAAAGGVGLIAGQWARHLGATTIGTVGSAEKAVLAGQNGYEHVINYSERDFVAEVKSLTKGELCNVVYDSVGKDTFEGSLDCVRRLGHIVSFGQSSGSVPPFNLAVLSNKGSLTLTRPTLFHYIVTREELEEVAAALFDVVLKGVVKIRIGQRYRLAEAAKAHADLEGRKTTGATVLIP
jgi:NADPH2:quinone reductase